MNSHDDLSRSYEQIAAAALKFPSGRKWDSLNAKYGLLSQMVSAEWSLKYEGKLDEQGEPPPKEERRASMDAVRFLRQEILRKTGQRIWGLTFTLYPNGKFNVEYDYNKPEGYEETDEVITGDDINSSLNSVLRGDQG
ncbi:hypothetical protein hmeg3_23810 [Herbaspirillum sp. meg3]|uniref:hypothetical protein n=1 Tax=Herbaspirillum sp. meg3 TaxID=2025949 RepID=UPI000B992900|nr:hypothetical protein [Herbaspirillum sp. meg3]ASU41028.1 hypothetical protein hmeg3_23810 [Herbaspirillum sp. meg3]